MINKSLIADSYEEVERAAQHMLAEDADFLKVMATGGNMTASSDPMKAQYDARTLLRIADILEEWFVAGAADGMLEPDESVLVELSGLDERAAASAARIRAARSALAAASACDS